MSFDVSIPVSCRTPWRLSIVDCGMKASPTRRVKCIFENRPPVIGHAVTARIRGRHHRRWAPAIATAPDWWTHPDRTAAADRGGQDTDEHPGVGAFVGEVHANILKLLDAWRCSPTGQFATCHVATIGLNFSPRASPSRMPTCISSNSVRRSRWAGLGVTSGDVLFGDCHGVIGIPKPSSPRCLSRSRMLAAERESCNCVNLPRFPWNNFVSR